MVLGSVFAVVIRLTPVFRNKKSQHTFTLNRQERLAAIYSSPPPLASYLARSLINAGGGPHLIICDDVNGKDEGSESGYLHQRSEIHREAVSFNDALIESCTADFI